VANRPQLVLASLSPRRSAILSELGLEFEIEPAEIDESRLPGESPEAYAVRVADAKAEARARPDALVVAADTIVVLGQAVLTKPADPRHAAEMLATLAGREHEVFTAVALRDGVRRGRCELIRSRVRIAPLTTEEIAWYVATGEPLDKAGSYAIQGLGSLFVESVAGSYTNIVGLPVPTLYRMFRELGYSLLEFRA
jgi:septum formation protein